MSNSYTRCGCQPATYRLPPYFCAAHNRPIDKPENYSPHANVTEYDGPTFNAREGGAFGLRESNAGVPVIGTEVKKRAVRESIPAMLPGSNIEQIDYSKFDVPGEPRTTLPTDPAARKNMPITAGVLDYFPAAIAEVARVSYIGNEKHNPGEDLHHARGKSMDHADCIARHLIERGTIDTVKLPDGREFKVRHSAYVAWRALALLQEELEAAGAPLARGAR